jgi:hypothetical protein
MFRRGSAGDNPGAGTAARAKRCRSSRADQDLAAAIDRMSRVERKAVQPDVGIITVYLFKLLAAGMA